MAPKLETSRKVLPNKRLNGVEIITFLGFDVELPALLELFRALRDAYSVGLPFYKWQYLASGGKSSKYLTVQGSKKYELGDGAIRIKLLLKNTWNT